MADDVNNVMVAVDADTLHDAVTHYAAWMSAMDCVIAQATTADTEDQATSGYWKHEKKKLHELLKALQDGVMP